MRGTLLSSTLNYPADFRQTIRRIVRNFVHCSTISLITLTLSLTPLFYSSNSYAHGPVSKTITEAPEQVKTFIDPKNPEFYERFTSPLLGVLVQLPKTVAEGFSLELLEFYSEMASYRQELLDTYGEERLVEIIEGSEKDSRGVPFVKPKKREGFGKGEIYLIDDIPVIRIVHTPSETALFFIDDPRVENNSVHLNKLISRTFMISNQPAPGVHKGYDVVIARITPSCEGGACDFTGYAKPIKFLDRAKHYLNSFHPGLTEKTGEKWWQRRLTPSTVKNLYAGVLTGAYQAAVLSSPMVGAAPEQALFTFAFSVGTNLNMPGFRRWNNQGSQAVFDLNNRQFEVPKNKLDMINPSKLQEKGSLWTLAKDFSTKPVRRSTMSWAFRLGLAFSGVVAAGGFNLSLESIGFGSAFMLANMATNILVSNANSTWWIEPVRLRAEQRLNKKPFFKPKAEATRDEIKKMYQMDSAEENIRYNLIWSLSILDVMGIASMSILLPGIADPVTFSMYKGALVFTAALGRWRAVRAAENMGSPRADAMRQAFENTFYMKGVRWMMDTPPAVAAANFSAEHLSPLAEKFVRKPYQAAKSAVANKCSFLLSRLNY